MHAGLVLHQDAAHHDDAADDEALLDGRRRLRRVGLVFDAPHERHRAGHDRPVLGNLDLDAPPERKDVDDRLGDRKSTRLNSSHQIISYAVFCLKKIMITIGTTSDLTPLFTSYSTATSSPTWIR